MLLSEWVVAILFGAVILTGLARCLGMPYPSFLALGGAALALVPGAPHLEMEPELALAPFAAPILLDAAYDTSLRDLCANWLPVAGLVLGAVGLTTATAAVVVHLLVVTLAAAVLLSGDVPHRDLILVSAFSVVLGTLSIQGLTLRFLLAWLDLRDDDPVAHEAGRARSAVLEAALHSLRDERSNAAAALRQEYQERLAQAKEDPVGEVTEGSENDRLLGLRDTGVIGDDAFHVVEAELDRIEMSVR